MTEQTGWRSGDVVVTPHVADHWWVTDCADVWGTVPKRFFPDPQALAEFIAAQRPRPRYASDGDADSRTISLVRDGMKPVVLVSNYSDDLDARTIAEHLADWLNEQEATDG